MKAKFVETHQWGVFWIDRNPAILVAGTVCGHRSDAIQAFNWVYGSTQNYNTGRKARRCKALRICGKL